ncbi:MAG: response regulator [Euryarchaeota archaeon]|nr:response regulator [Euryarchaeota archaeon]
MPNEKILIVEDEKITAMGLKNKLEKLGYKVTGLASSGTEALAKIAENPPDLVLMDIVLKDDMDGIEAAKKIREELDVPIIYLTAYADDEMIKRAALTEPYGYILKPFKIRELKANIELALYKQRSEKEEIIDFEDIYRDVTRFLKEKEESIKRALIADDAVSYSSNITLDVGINKIYISTPIGERSSYDTIHSVLRNIALNFFDKYGGKIVVYPKGDDVCLELTKPEIKE